MIVDSSAIMAILKREPEHSSFLTLMKHAPRCAMSAGTWIEMTVVLLRGGNVTTSKAFDALAEALPLVIEPVTTEQAHLGSQAYRRYGRGSGDPADLNFGDCFSYALAMTTGEPLLFKGDDFSRTNVLRAV